MLVSASQSTSLSIGGNLAAFTANLSASSLDGIPINVYKFTFIVLIRNNP